MNKVILSGRLVADPETRYTQDGKLIYKFRFAVNRRTGSEHPEADYFACVAFRFTADRMNKCSIVKGTKLGLIGELRNNNYDDRNGTKHYEQQIVVDDFEFLEKKSEGSSVPAGRGQSDNWVPTNEKAPFPDVPEGKQEGLEDDDLPF